MVTSARQQPRSSTRSLGYEGNADRVCAGAGWLRLSGRAAGASILRVEVPVQVPCRAQEVAVPTWAADGLRRTDSLELKVRALLAERRQRIGYEQLLEAAHRACQ